MDLPSQQMHLKAFALNANIHVLLVLAHQLHVPLALMEKYRKGQSVKTILTVNVHLY